MPNIDLGALRRQGSRALSGFTSGQRAMLALALAGTFFGGMFFLKWSSSTEYAPLYTDLEASDAAEVTAALDGQGVDYQLEDGGSTILVARADVYRARIDLSAEGLPSGGGSAGYELLDQQGITTSEFRQRVDYQRALEGELARTIESIDGVEDAIVHLVMPEDDLFSGDAQHPSASVLVSTAGGEIIPTGQVQAVVNLVASSVEGLEADQVTVADGAGRVLSAPGEDGLAAAAGDARTSQTATFEGAMASRIEEMLVPVTGAGRARVSVTAQLDFDRRETTSETFGLPDTAPVISETTDTETFEGDSTAVGGVLGPDAIPTTAEDGGDGSTYNRSSTERVFANERITQVVQDAPGDVQRLSVAVLLDEAAGIDGPAVQQLVAAGAGIDIARGDTLEVTQLPFDTSAAETAAAELQSARSAQERGQLFSLLRTVGSVAIVAIVLFLAWRSTRKAAVNRFPLAIELDGADPDERGLPVGSATGIVDDEHWVALPSGPSEADLQREELQGQITDLIERQPDDVAQVLRSWMSEKV